ncbi:hypothetical protein [Nostoc sp. FACHB-888]|uniref:hypothetical protein n=1 Tax=Nostoc sp. FACHB-888 TaxID=2692842 RepID=UPI001F54CE0C|nr:hypothetical protein [Nostoc sp. FACHB-888]
MGDSYQTIVSIDENLRCAAGLRQVADDLLQKQCVKEIAQFRRDRLTLALAFLLPFITLVIFGFTIRLESKDIPLIVQDLNRTNLSSISLLIYQ